MSFTSDTLTLLLPEFTLTVWYTYTDVQSNDYNF